MIQTNPTTNNKNRKKPAPFIAPGSAIPVSKKEIESRKQKNELLKCIGICKGIVDTTSEMSQRRRRDLNAWPNPSYSSSATGSAP